jgi:hypothetical protein
VAPAAEPNVEPEAPETVPEDTASTGPTEVEAPQPPVEEPEVADEHADEPEAETESEQDDDEDEGEPLPPADEERVMLGPVEGRLFQVPLESVRNLLGDALSQRVDYLRGDASIEDVQKRVLATDGRSTPVIFSQDGDNPPTLIDGVQCVAAAMNIGMTSLPVILVTEGDVGMVQSYLASKGRGATPTNTDEDEDLYMRVAYSDLDVDF